MIFGRKEAWDEAVVIEHFLCVNKAGGTTCWDSVIGFMSCPDDGVAGEFPAWVVVSTEGAGQVLIPPLEPAMQPAQRHLFALIDASDLEAAAYGCVFF